MGYCVTMDVNVKIKKEHIETVKKLFESLDQSGQKFNWVNKGYSKFDNVEDMFDEWRYNAFVDNDYLIIDEFHGEKLGSDSVLWKKLACVVENDSEILCRGEDGSIWKYLFKDGKFEEKYPTITW